MGNVVRSASGGLSALRQTLGEAMFTAEYWCSINLCLRLTGDVEPYRWPKEPTAERTT